MSTAIADKALARARTQSHVTGVDRSIDTEARRGDLDRTLLLVASHYRNTEEVRAFVEQVMRLPLPEGWRVELAISDNSESWPDADPHPCARIVRPYANLGYLGGCAHAFETWVAERGVPGWVGVVNTDLELDEDCFMALLDGEFAVDTGVVAPAVRLPDGTHQNPYLRHRPAASRMLLMRLVFRSAATAWTWSLAHDLARRVRPHSREHGVRLREPIYAPHGSIMFFRRRFFEDGGRLRFGGFMYGEELHVAEQARRLGLRVQYEPACKVLHKAHAVVGRIPSATNRAWRAQSSDWIWSTYFRWGFAG